ncbi:MAG: DNA replication/repair protein RecF [Gammaproteobacteria bacterium]|nr:DNA replication/repair protein RecF [Gammaproteobacteria bacterium]
MAIQTLEIQHLRNLTDLVISPQPGLNFVFGANGSGKTSLLEAIHCLGRGKSFRTHKTNLLINEHSQAFTVVGRIRQKGRNITIGMQRSAGHSQIRLNGHNITRISELTEVLPIAVIDPGLHRLMEEGPDLRRRFLDWGVFHVEHAFNGIWNNYRRCLAQRNAALRAGWSQQAIAHWDQELAAAGGQLDRARRAYLERLLPFVREFLVAFPAVAGIDIRYLQGWREGEDYLSYLSAHYLSDRERGFTQFGPHRADLRIRIEGVEARDFLSRGQQKILVANLILAQCRQMTAQNISAVVLVDDLPAELDAGTREILLELLQNSQAQVFLTSTDPTHFATRPSAAGVFHVEHGRLRPV